MDFDFEGFKPGTVEDLAQGLGSALSAAAAKWFSTQREQINGYLVSIAEAVIQTQTSLAAKRIGRQQAAALMTIHKTTFKVYLAGLKYETFEFMQTMLDTAVKALGYAVFNTTGINIAPQVVRS